MEWPNNHCAECGETNVKPHPDFTPLRDGACMCEDCGDEWLETPRDLEDSLDALLPYVGLS